MIHSDLVLQWSTKQKDGHLVAPCYRATPARGVSRDSGGPGDKGAGLILAIIQTNVLMFHGKKRTRSSMGTPLKWGSGCFV